MKNIRITLHKTRFPENVGMAARACANFGCSDLALSQPENANLLNAYPLATPKGQALLKNASIYPNLAAATESCHFVFGTTARKGGWRRHLLLPEEAAKIICSSPECRHAIIFGPEDRGLENAEISNCDYLINIPVRADAPSLNLGQAVLVVLYECFKFKMQKASVQPQMRQKDASLPATAKEKNLFLEKLKNVLLEIDYLHGENPEYFFLQWRQMISRLTLKRHELSALLGLCRQISHKIKSNKC